MKNHVKMGFAAFISTVLALAWWWTQATTVTDPVDWRDGDLIIMDTRNTAVLPLFAAEGSGQSHIAIVAHSDAGATLIEVGETVTETPLRALLRRDPRPKFSVWRLSGLTPVQGAAIVAGARAQLGKPADFFLRPGPDQLYSSELVQMAYAGAGVPLGRMQRFGKVAQDLATVQARFSSRWQELAPCKRRYLTQEQCWEFLMRQDVVTPSSIITDPRMSRVYESLAPMVASPAGSVPPSGSAG